MMTAEPSMSDPDAVPDISQLPAGTPGLHYSEQTIGELTEDDDGVPLGVYPHRLQVWVMDVADYEAATGELAAGGKRA